VTSKRLLFVGIPVIACCVFWGVRRGCSELAQDRIVRLAELEIYSDQLESSKAALKKRRSRLRSALNRAC
jgi:hypothetical protein